MSKTKSKRLKVKVLIITNGTLLERIPLAALSRLHKLTISINSMDDRIHRKIHSYGGDSQLPTVRRNVARLRACACSR